MEENHLNIEYFPAESLKQVRFKTIIMYTGYFYSLISVVALVGYFQNGFGNLSTTMFNLFAGFLMITYGKGTWSKNKGCFFKSNDETVSFRTLPGAFGGHTLKWEKIEGLKFYDNELIFFLNSGQKKECVYTNMSKENKSELKRTLKQIAKAKRIKIVK